MSSSIEERRYDEMRYLEPGPGVGPWTPWNGGACPFAPDKELEVKLRNGTERHALVPAFDTLFEHDIEGANPNYDVIGYREV